MTDEENREDEDSITERDTRDADDETSSVGELRQRRGRSLIPPGRTAGQVEVRPTPAEAREECVVCMQHIVRHSRGIQPCPCGYWVHHYCLLNGIQKYEAKYPGCDSLGCRFCLTPYNIWPRKHFVVEQLEKICFKYEPIIKFGFGTLSVVLVDATFAVIGMTALKMVYGNKEIEEMCLSMGPIKSISIFKSIPLISIVVNSITWENKLLHCLRRFSRLPVIGGLFPTLDPHIQEEKHNRTQLGVLVGGLLLPWAAELFGVVLFGAVQSRLQRHLLGGGAFLMFKGSLYMYYRQKLYARQCLLTVEAYS